METTFAMIKPDAVGAGNADAIIDMIKDHGFTIKDMRQINMSSNEAIRLYDIHKDKPFFTEMVEFITSGPVVVLALEKEDAIKKWRDLMGATNPADAAEGTVRHKYGKSIGNNAAHGSDAQETAIQELTIFFPHLLK